MKIPVGSRRSRPAPRRGGRHADPHRLAGHAAHAGKAKAARAPSPSPSRPAHLADNYSGGGRAKVTAPSPRAHGATLVREEAARRTRAEQRPARSAADIESLHRNGERMVAHYERLADARPPQNAEDAARLAGQTFRTERVHSVQPGESLRGVAEREWGDAERWPLLVPDNRDVIEGVAQNGGLTAGEALFIPTATGRRNGGAWSRRTVDPETEALIRRVPDEALDRPAAGTPAALQNRLMASGDGDLAAHEAWFDGEKSRLDDLAAERRAEAQAAEVDADVRHRAVDQEGRGSRPNRSSSADGSRSEGSTKASDDPTAVDGAGEGHRAGPTRDRAIDPVAIAEDASAIFSALEGGVTGLGTDEATVFRILDNRTPAEISALEAAYREIGDGERPLRDHLQAELAPGEGGFLQGNEWDWRRAEALLDSDQESADLYAIRKEAGRINPDESLLLDVARRHAGDRDFAERYESEFGRDYRNDAQRGFSRAQRAAFDALEAGDSRAVVAAQVHDAAGWNGLGTDVRALDDALADLPRAERQAVGESFEALYGVSMAEHWSHHTRGLRNGTKEWSTALLADAPKDESTRTANLRAARIGYGLKNADYGMIKAELRAGDVDATAERYEATFDVPLRTDMKKLLGHHETEVMALIDQDGKLSWSEQVHHAFFPGVTGLGTDEAALRTLFEGRSEREIDAHIAAYNERYGDEVPSGVDAFEHHFREVSGRDRLVLEQMRMGAPDLNTWAGLETAIDRGRALADAERTAAGRFFAGFNLTGMGVDALARYDGAAQRLETLQRQGGDAPTAAERDEVLALAAIATGEADAERAAKESAAETAATVAAGAAGVGIAALTGGAGAPLAASLAMAAAGGGTAKVLTESAIVGDQVYGDEEQLQDLFTGAVVGSGAGYGVAATEAALASAAGGSFPLRSLAAASAVEGGASGAVERGVQAASQDAVWSRGLLDGAGQVAGQAAAAGAVGFAGAFLGNAAALGAAGRAARSVGDDGAGALAVPRGISPESADAPLSVAAAGPRRRGARLADGLGGEVSVNDRAHALLGYRVDQFRRAGVPGDETALRTRAGAEAWNDPAVRAGLEAHGFTEQRWNRVVAGYDVPELDVVAGAAPGPTTHSAGPGPAPRAQRTQPTPEAHVPPALGRAEASAAPRRAKGAFTSAEDVARMGPQADAHLFGPPRIDVDGLSGDAWPEGVHFVREPVEGSAEGAVWFSVPSEVHIAQLRSGARELTEPYRATGSGLIPDADFQRAARLYAHSGGPDEFEALMRRDEALARYLAPVSRFEEIDFAEMWKNYVAPRAP